MYSADGTLVYVAVLSAQLVGLMYIGEYITVNLLE